uniref:Putative DNA replication initiation protein n=1 Tax=viral metagenome TaxID=1070528 RepID=A0A6H1ZX49_9ZZZZ
MIPDKSTPIKNEILINIFAKGLLNKDEMRIIFYIIRWSWGFDGVSRRQDWTKELTKRQIANGIEMHESHFNRNINRMIIEKKIIIKDGCYQFNEHYEEWENLPKSQVLDDNKLTKLVNKTYQNGKVNLPKSQVILTKKVSSTGLKPLQNKPLPDRKETIKETLKETLKEKGDIFLNTWKDFIDMRKEINKKISKVGQSRMLNRLNDLSNNENIQIEILNQSIMNSWTTVWPLKGGINGQFTGTNGSSKKPGEDKYKHLEETY